MYSIYHFFKTLWQSKNIFLEGNRLEDFPFDERLLSCRNSGIFPDLAIRLNQDRSVFTGGELIEMKDSDGYTISSFNSTIPTRSKEISKIITSETSTIRTQMTDAGNDIDSLPVRDVFYLVRGKRRNNIKVCLVYGSFFETIRTEELISQAFSQVLDERLEQSGENISDDLKEILLTIFSQQQNFSKVRDVDNASVKLRFRIMTEAKAEGNILNSKKYPEIIDNTLNFVLPCDTKEEEEDILRKLKIVFDDDEFSQFNIFTIKHHFNGYFLVVQTPLLK
jgi:hypothetical protein